MRQMQIPFSQDRSILRSDRGTLLLFAVRRNFEVLSQLSGGDERSGRESRQGAAFPSDLADRGGGDPLPARQRMIRMIRV